MYCPGSVEAKASEGTVLGSLVFLEGAVFSAYSKVLEISVDGGLCSLTLSFKSKMYDQWFCIR